MDELPAAPQPSRLRGHRQRQHRGPPPARAEPLRAGTSDSEPDPAGLAYWSGQLGKPRFDQDTLEASLLASKRFYDQAGGTNGDYVEVLFDFLLFRGPTSGERSIWTTYLGRNGSRAAMARSLLATTEHRAMVVIDEYNMLLGQRPGAGGDRHLGDLPPARW